MARTRLSLRWPLLAVILLGIALADGHSRPEHVHAAADSCTSALTLGVTVQCSLDATPEVDVFTVSANLGDTLIVRMADTSGPITARVRIFRPSNAEIVSCAKIGGTLAESICPLDVTGQFTILADDSLGDNTGTYSLYVNRTNAPSGAIPIADGATTTSSFLAAELGAWTFAASPNARVLIRTVDTQNAAAIQFRLYDSHGTQVCTDTGTILAEALCTLLEGGAYSVLVGDVSGPNAATYASYLKLTTVASNAIGVSFADTIVGALSPATLGAYAFTGSAGDVVIARSVDASGPMTMETRIYRPDGSLLCSAIASTLAEAVCTLDANGPHLMLVGDSLGDNAGTYAGHVQRLSVPAESMPLLVGQSTTAQLSFLAETDGYSFAGSAGTTAVVTVQDLSGALVVRARVYNAAGALQCQATSATQVQIQCAITQDGTYYVVVDTASGDHVGVYGVQLQCIGCAALPADVDGDGIANGSDNCPTIANPSQTNTDAQPITATGQPADITVAYGDNLGDACDTDDDNDGRFDDRENHLCGATGASNPLLADTDGDRVRDGAECLLGSDPTNAASRPNSSPADDADGDTLAGDIERFAGSNPASPDSDGDGVLDGVEFKGYGTLAEVTDSDGDTCSDAREIGSINGDSAVNSLDLLNVAQQFGLTTRAVPDVNKDGNVNSLDLQLVARAFNPANC